MPIQGLRTLFGRRWFRRTMGGLLATVVGLWIAAACALQFWLFPHLNDYREPLAEAVGKALGLKVEVGELSGGWAHLHPRFALNDVVVFDSKNQPAVQLSQVKAEIAWLPLLTGTLGFRALTVETPSLDFRRDSAGHLFLSGLQLDGGGDFRVDALLEQGEINLRSGRVSWSDGLRRSPTLTLSDVTLRLKTSGAKHRAELAFVPPESLGEPTSVRVDWTGRSFSEWQSWQSTIALKTQALNLAGWSAWVDYPLPVSSGTGKFDLSVSTKGLALTQAEGDVTLTDLKVRLAPEIQPLELKRFASGIELRRQDEGQAVQIKLDGLTYTDASGKTEPPTDLFFKRVIGAADEKQTQDISFRATRLDLARLRRVADALPLPTQLRQQLESAAPSGMLEKLNVHGLIVGDALPEYAVQGAFSDFAIRSDDGSKFVKGFTGTLDMTHQGGKLVLRSENAVLAAPDVLPINQVPLDQLTGLISWKKTGDILALKVKGVQLRNSELQAEANGTWSGDMNPAATEMDKDGTVAMNIFIENAKTESGWKYIPLSASADISKWMKQAISGGSISGFRIEMDGRVWGMPYGSPEAGAAPGSSAAVGAPGKFYLGFKTKNVTVKYADGYPPLENLDASFDMNQNQIKIVANRGQINGMKFAAIKADMADVSAYENHLLISGQAEGPTSSAVSFLKDTPLAEHIHHFADDMSADGTGRLDVAVNLNMANDSDVKVQGQYTFVNNRISVVPSTMPVTGVNGVIKFSESTIDSQDLQGQWSGEPLSIRIATDDKGASINASGRANVAELRHYYDLPVFDQLSGKTEWQAKVMMQGGRIDLTLTSDLRGVTSSLPEPFNKTAGSALPLAMSRQTAVLTGRKGSEALAQIWRLTLGNAAAATLGMNSKGQIVRGKVILGSGQT
ncbi:MAG: YhdP family phospholipid transporter, partial [Fluviibacter sp.]